MSAASKLRLDQALVARGLVATRSQAESYIKLGYVTVNGQAVTKPGLLISESDKVAVTAQQYVSRAALKLASVAKALRIDFKDKVVLDVGSSTGGFTDYALKHGARKVIAVDVGTNQLHPSLRTNPNIELYENSDIRKITVPSKPILQGRTLQNRKEDFICISETPNIVLIDVSFISLREVLPHVLKLMAHGSLTVAMVKPQFEAGSSAKHKGVIKNDKMRRDILKSFEIWVQGLFVIVDKADSAIAGAKGNQERFYLLKGN